MPDLHNPWNIRLNRSPDAHFNAFLVISKWLEPRLKHLKSIAGDVEASFEIEVSAFETSPRLIFWAT